MDNTAFKIAIVGLGPKGLYGFERLLAELKANSIQEKVEIYLFNKTKFMGSGDVYRSDQPDYLLMNFANKHIHMWTEDSPSTTAEKPLSLSEFLSKKTQQSIAEIDEVYSSRATVGRYLEDGFLQLCKNLPENIVLHQLVSEVNSIAKNDGKYSIAFTKDGDSYQRGNFQTILIATGHQRHKRNSKPDTISFIYPVEKKMMNLPENKKVAIKGMGLTFIDAALALTEGKGGLFAENQDGKLIYKTSGNEPKCIFPFSKSGWLMWPKYNFDDDQALYIEGLLTSKHEKLNFKRDILPLLTQDMEFAYYKILFSDKNETLEFQPNYDEVKYQIEDFHDKYAEFEAFSMNNVLEPEFNSAISIHQTVTNMLQEFTDENLNIITKAKLGAAAVWRKASPIFNELYSFNGLDAVSHREFDTYYFGKLNRIAYGPPLENLKKILALVNAGSIHFQFAKSPNVEALENGYRLNNSDSEIRCAVLIDARIPKNTLDKEASGIFKSLCKNQLARPHLNKDETGSYSTNSVEINIHGNLINPNGKIEHITLYGTPTEGIVHDNDTLSRSRNNFAKPWTKKVIQQIKNSKNEIERQTTKAYAHIK